MEVMTMTDETTSAGLPAVMEQMVGRWAGTMQLWMEGEQKADEGPFEGEVLLLLGGRFLAYRYGGPIFKDPTEGFATIGYNAADDQVEMSWIDSWHMGQAQMFCVGPLEPAGFSVLGHFPDRASGTLWGWRTRFVLDGNERLTVSATIITPEGAEGKAVDTVYRRVR
jgi:hypothetical protein